MPSNRPDRFNERARKLFLAEYEKTGLVQRSADVAGVHRSTVWAARKNDPEFAEMCDDAAARFCDTLEAEARRRAVEGVDEPVYYKGEKCGKIRKYSDRMLELMLRGHIPDRYRDRVSVDAKVTGGVLVVGPKPESTDVWALQHGETMTPLAEGTGSDDDG